MKAIAKATGRGNFRQVEIEMTSTAGLHPGDAVLIGDETLRIVAVQQYTPADGRQLNWGCLVVVMGVIAFWLWVGALAWWFLG